MVDAPNGIGAHWPCITADGSPDGWATVPSLRRRRGPHPLEQVTGGVLARYPQIPLHAAADVVSPREITPDNFTVEPTSADHVLLIDDTWVTGGHLQSAAKALKAAGVTRVTALCIARWLDPDFADTRAYLDDLTEQFDPDICPFTGRRC